MDADSEENLEEEDDEEDDYNEDDNDEDKVHRFSSRGISLHFLFLKSGGKSK